MKSLFVQLLDHGADVHHVSYYPEGTTALHEAIRHMPQEIGRFGNVTLLVSAGACPTLQDCKGYHISHE